MESPAVLELQRKLTLDYIAYDSVSIELRARTKESDGAGGEKLIVQDPRPAQTFSLIEPGSSGFYPPTVSDAGEQYSVDFMLLGAHDADVRKNDVFTHNGDDYMILAIMPFNDYETRAVVIRHAWS